jgi:hypothetical protein
MIYLKKRKEKSFELLKKVLKLLKKRLYEERWNLKPFGIENI